MIAPDPSTDAGATDELFSVVYDELKRLARRQLRAVGANATISTTELVHETFMKLDKGRVVEWDDRAHFFGSAARAMRQVLVDFARRRQAAKRKGAQHPVTFTDAEASLQIELDEILALDRALDRLHAVDERLRQVVELRFFAGVPERDIAQMLGVSSRTVERDWLKARLFLLRELEPHP